MIQRICIYIVVFYIILPNVFTEISLGTAHADSTKDNMATANKGYGEKIIIVKPVNDPSAMAIDSDGSLYIAEPHKKCVYKFDKTGELKSTIKITVPETNTDINIDDIFVDKKKNLYIASRRLMRIDKYDSGGKLTLSINLADKEIFWDTSRLWIQGAIQITRMRADEDENIYLEGFNELIKFNNVGQVMHKWGQLTYGNATKFVLDERSNLHLLRQGKEIEQYDKSGKLIASGGCGDLYSLYNEGNCILPEYVDESGYLYWPEKNSSILVKAGRAKNALNKIPISYIYENTEKFDPQGSFYKLYKSDDKCWIVKYSWK